MSGEEPVACRRLVGLASAWVGRSGSAMVSGINLNVGFLLIVNPIWIPERSWPQIGTLSWLRGAMHLCIPTFADLRQNEIYERL